MPPTRLTEIIKGKRAVTAETALLLAEYLGTSPRACFPAHLFASFVAFCANSLCHRPLATFFFTLFGGCKGAQTSRLAANEVVSPKPSRALWLVRFSRYCVYSFSIVNKRLSLVIGGTIFGCLIWRRLNCLCEKEIWVLLPLAAASGLICAAVEVLD